MNSNVFRLFYKPEQERNCFGFLSILSTQLPIYILIFLVCPGLFLFSEIIAGDDYTAYLNSSGWISEWSVQIGRPLRGLINYLTLDGFPIRPASLLVFMFSIAVYCLSLVLRLGLPAFLAPIFTLSILSSGFLVELYQFSIMQLFSAFAFFFLAIMVIFDDAIDSNSEFKRILFFAFAASLLATIRIEFLIISFCTFIIVCANECSVSKLFKFTALSIFFYLFWIVLVTLFLNIELGTSHAEYNIKSYRDIHLHLNIFKHLENLYFTLKLVFYYFFFSHHMFPMVGKYTFIAMLLVCLISLGVKKDTQNHFQSFLFKIRKILIWILFIMACFGVTWFTQWEGRYNTLIPLTLIPSFTLLHFYDHLSASTWMKKSAISLLIFSCLIGVVQMNAASVRAYNLQQANFALVDLIVSKTNAFEKEKQIKIYMYGCMSQSKAAENFIKKGRKSPFFDTYSGIWGHSIIEVGMPLSCQFSRLNMISWLRFPGSNIKWIKIRRDFNSVSENQNNHIDPKILKKIDNLETIKNSILHTIDDHTYLFVFSPKHLFDAS